MNKSLDIIGDIHGHLQPLEALLQRLGYEHRGGAWRHSERLAVFVGDFIDRGPAQLGVLELAADMLEAGSGMACQGNHELNASGYGTTGSDGRHLRVRGSKNRHQHRAFLEAVGEDTPLHTFWVNWFRQLPLWLELPHARIVHACWNQEMVDRLKPHLLPGARLPQDIEPFFKAGSPLTDAIETLLKGPEVTLPDSVRFFDKDGVARRNTRIAWWDREATTLKRAALVDEVAAMTIPDIPLALAGQPDEYDPKRPIFFGHYWMSGQPRLIADHAVCLDFSIAKDGVLAAYSHDAGAPLTADRFTWVGPGAESEPGPGF